MSRHKRYIITFHKLQNTRLFNEVYSVVYVITTMNYGPCRNWTSRNIWVLCRARTEFVKCEF